MTPIIADSRRTRGAALRQARAARTRAIRRRVATGAVSLFMATWLLIAVVLVSGHDPALAARKLASTSTTTSTTAATSPTTTSSAKTSSAKTSSAKTSSAKTSSGTTSSAQTSSATTASAGSGLTTRQS
jgi:hypothetical protein